jgi:hypothetical protein
MVEHLLARTTSCDIRDEADSPAAAYARRPNIYRVFSRQHS